MPTAFPTPDTSAPVLVTGATGYVAGWLIKDLLDAGLTVHAAVRDPSNSAMIAPLERLAAQSPGRIRFFRTDLLKDGSYGAAMQGCGIVFHTASPFTLNVADPQKDLIDPAVLGTRNVLTQANRTSSVARVVLTSSCAAIYTDAVDCAAAPGGTLTEEVWNRTASLAYQPYSYSKTLAEKEAWTIAKAQDRWDMVVINPSLVLGPALDGHPTSESFTFMRRYGDGTLRMGAPRFGLGVVDVRDVAQAHMAAAFTAAASGRHIVSGPGTDLLEIGETLRERFGKTYPIPTRAMPKWLIWLTGPLSGVSRRYVARNVDLPWRADNSKSKQALGLRYRPLTETTNEMFTQMIDAGAFAKRR